MGARVNFIYRHVYSCRTRACLFEPAYRPITMNWFERNCADGILMTACGNVIASLCEADESLTSRFRELRNDIPSRLSNLSIANVYSIYIYIDIHTHIYLWQES